MKLKIILSFFNELILEIITWVSALSFNSIAKFSKAFISVEFSINSLCCSNNSIVFLRPLDVPSAFFPSKFSSIDKNVNWDKKKKEK